MEIRIHPDHLRTVASQLSHQSEEVQALLENMLRSVGGLSTGWAGVAWNEYLDRFQTEVPRMRDSLRETLTGLIQDLRRIADEFERTDQETVAASGARAGAVLGMATAVPTAILASAAGVHPMSERDQLALKLQLPKGHKDEVESVAFSSDGETLASGAKDGTVRLWRVSDGVLLRTLEGHTGPVWSVAFSPDVHLLASGSEDGTVRLWGVR